MFDELFAKTHCEIMRGSLFEKNVMHASDFLLRNCIMRCRVYQSEEMLSRQAICNSLFISIVQLEREIGQSSSWSLYLHRTLNGFQSISTLNRLIHIKIRQKFDLLIIYPQILSFVESPHHRWVKISTHFASLPGIRYETEMH